MTISYNITSDVTGLFGAQLELSFDPAVLQVVGAGSHAGKLSGTRLCCHKQRR